MVGMNAELELDELDVEDLFGKHGRRHLEEDGTGSGPVMYLPTHRDTPSVDPQIGHWRAGHATAAVGAELTDSSTHCDPRDRQKPANDGQKDYSMVGWP